MLKRLMADFIMYAEPEVTITRFFREINLDV